MKYMVAGIDVHKRMLAVVVAEAKVGEMEFERRRFQTTRSGLMELAQWLKEREVKEAVMESTAQYWRPVWLALEQTCKLQLAQARSNGARRGRKSDFRDAERMVQRLISGDLVLSFVPEEEQRGWRFLARTRYTLVRERGRVQSHIEGLLEDAQIKLSSKIKDLLGVSGRRILQALAEHKEGPLDVVGLAALGDPQLQATPEELQDALNGRWLPRHGLLLSLHLERIQILDRQIDELYTKLGEAMKAHQQAIARVSEVPGFGPDSAMQVIAELGPQAAVFPTPGQLASWIGVCPGQQESAGHSSSDQSPKGNRTMRRILDQAAWAAVKKKGSFFQALYRRMLARSGEQQTIWAVAHRLCRLLWKILHEGVRYIEQGTPIVNVQTMNRRQRRLTAEFRKLGFQVTFTPIAQPVKG